MDTSYDVHLFSCLLLLSRKLLMDLTLVCRGSLSALLIIFLALSVLIVVLSLILTGTTDTSKHEYSMVPVVAIFYL